MVHAKLVDIILVVGVVLVVYRVMGAIAAILCGSSEVGIGIMIGLVRAKLIHTRLVDDIPVVGVVLVVHWAKGDDACILAVTFNAAGRIMLRVLCLMMVQGV